MGAILGGAAILGGTSLLGGLLSKGSKPKVPAFKPIDFQAEQKQAIQQNIEALQPATELAQKTTAAEQSQLEAQLRRAIPGYDQLIQQASQNIGSALRGELSPEATRNLQRFSAGQALTRGYGGGSGMGLFGAVQNYARASEARQQQGLAQAQNFIQQQRAFGMAQPFSVSSMFITPSQRIGALQQQNQQQYNRDLQAAQVAAMPDPTMAAIGSAISSAGGFAGGAYTQRGLMGMQGSPRSSYNPQNDPEIYALPPTNIGGPTDYSNWA
jgi:hypothetical protein